MAGDWAWLRLGKGLLHEEEYNRPTFVFDSIEQFRPWVDCLVAELAIGGLVNKKWFRKGKEGVWLEKGGKKHFIPAWYDMMEATVKFLERRIKKKDKTQYLCSTLAQQLLAPKQKVQDD